MITRNNITIKINDEPHSNYNTVFGEVSASAKIQYPSDYSEASEMAVKRVEDDIIDHIYGEVRNDVQSLIVRYLELKGVILATNNPYLFQDFENSLMNLLEKLK